MNYPECKLSLEQYQVINKAFDVLLKEGGMAVVNQVFPIGLEITRMQEELRKEMTKEQMKQNEDKSTLKEPKGVTDGPPTRKKPTLLKKPR